MRLALCGILGVSRFLCQRGLHRREGESPIFADTKIGTVPEFSADNLLPPFYPCSQWLFVGRKSTDVFLRGGY
jgi:hypothetical protein